MTAMSQSASCEKHKRVEVDVKVVVVGGPRVGKTSFIRALWERHQPEEIYHENGAAVYPCWFMSRRAAIYEIPDDPAFGIDRRTPYYRDGHVFVWMYAIDDPRGFTRLVYETIREAKTIIDWDEMPMILVGNKCDLRDDPQVIERLAQENSSDLLRAPVTSVSALRWLLYNASTHFFEISIRTSEHIDEVFDTIVYLALHN